MPDVTESAVTTGNTSDSREDRSMMKALVLTLALVLAVAPVLPAAAQSGDKWKPEVRFIKIGVSSAGGDWFRAGAKFSTMVPAVLPDIAASTVIGGGVVNVTRIGKGETQMGFALTPYPEQGYKGESKHYPTPLKNVRLIASNLGRHVVVAIVVLKDSPIKTIHDLKGKASSRATAGGARPSWPKRSWRGA